MTATSRERVPPSARRLMQSLRDLGYDLPSAIADLVDNSIAARATTVRIDVGFEGRESWIRIADNGTGMTGPVLKEAMRYGSQRDDYDEADLGKYGLGLKTASMSQCRVITVASRHGTDARISVRRWDLDEVIHRDEWDLERPRIEDCRVELVEPLKGHKGTVVLWERLDRVLEDYEHPAGQAAESGLKRSCRDIERHLAMVFNRFLAGEAKRSLPLRIFLNDNPIAPWDPFCRDEKHTRELPPRTVTLEVEDEKHRVRVEPYVLPNQSQFSDRAAFDAAGGPHKWNNQQGFYIYRADRMIQSGGWNRVRTPDEHTKTARVAVLFDRDADDAFGINVAKMRVTLPRELRSQFEEIAAEVTKKANATYRQSPDERGGRHGALAGRATRGGGGTGPGRGQVANFDARRDASIRLIRRIVRVLEEEVGGQPRLLRRLLLALAKVDPIFAAELGASTKAS